jgi:Ni,Fe-hydrogenase III small subunit/Pyruvate/2-oxoacid:ferredoxin oxidoreductase delta subunit
MLRALRVRLSQGSQYIRDPRVVEPVGFVGRAELDTQPCAEGCGACRDICPTQAIALAPLRLDLGRCVFCQECVPVCPEHKIRFTPSCRVAATSPAALVVKEGQGPDPVAVSTELRRLFGRSLKLRSVSAGGCNACELELGALGNVNFDLGRYGIELTASPRHADALVLSGPLTRNMAEALELAYAAMPAPKFVIAFGACAISGGLYADSTELERGFLGRFAPQLYVPGCPPHPLAFVQGILDLLGIG